MAGLRVFVSSTCYDLTFVRSQLRLFIQNLGHEPIMSDFHDILYAPDEHTHTSCIAAVANADMMILIIGGRKGGEVVGSALETLDQDKISTNFNGKIKPDYNQLSITQVEFLQAVQLDIPIFPFVLNDVYHDHHLYGKNKDLPNIREIKFPSIQKNETALDIFKFIDLVIKRNKNNSIVPFDSIEKIESVLKKQWSSLFKKYLDESKNKETIKEANQDIISKINDLESLVKSTIKDVSEQKDIQVALKYRLMYEFISSFSGFEKEILKELRLKDLKEVLATLNIKKEISLENPSIQNTKIGIELSYIINFNDLFKNLNFKNIVYIRNDASFYLFNDSNKSYHAIIKSWKAFMELSKSEREKIVNALSATTDSESEFLIYHAEPLKTMLNPAFDINQHINEISDLAAQKIRNQPDESHGYEGKLIN